jgi:hypothetical protein
MRRVLIVSPHFPPVNAPDMQRVRMSLPYYRACGWEPIVLAVGDAWQDAVREPELLATIPDGVRVVRCAAVPVRWSRLVGIGNLGLRAWFPLFFTGLRLLRREKFDLVLFSNTQFITFVFGRLWLWLCGVPYVLDVQDPWRTDYYERHGSRPPPGEWKYQVARLQAALLERWCFRRAAGVMSVSAQYLDDLRARYRFLSNTPATVIRFGASRADLERALLVPQAAHRYSRQSCELHLLYTGASGPVIPHALTVLFGGLRRYRERSPERARRLRFHFLGTSYVAPGQGQDSVMPLARQCGVADQVTETAHRLGHLECLRLQHDADVLLLPGSSDLAYSPSKVYAYYLTGRPILGLVFKGSVMERLLIELNCAYLVHFSEHEDKEAAHEALCGFFDLAIDGFPPGSLPPRNEAYFDAHYLAETLTRRQCELFERIVPPKPVVS